MTQKRVKWLQICLEQTGETVEINKLDKYLSDMQYFDLHRHYINRIEEEDTQMKTNYSGGRPVIAFIVLLSALLSLAGCALRPEQAAKALTVSLLRVGKADAIILLSDSCAMLIDAGEEDDGQEIMDFLREKGVGEIEAMIVTHYDQDHVGGADTVLEQIPVKKVYAPAYEGTGQEYRDFVDAAEAAAVPVYRLEEPVSFPFSDAEVLIEPPRSYEVGDSDEETDNNFSLITTVRHGEDRLVFMGDAEKQRIRQWLEDSRPEPCDFLKVPHHGVYNKALEELLGALSPKYAVVCSSRKNPAEEKTMEMLKQYCPNVYQTKDGDVTVVSSGTGVEAGQDTKH